MNFGFPDFSITAYVVISWLTREKFVAANRRKKTERRSSERSRKIGTKPVGRTRRGPQSRYTCSTSIHRRYCDAAIAVGAVVVVVVVVVASSCRVNRPVTCCNRTIGKIVRLYRGARRYHQLYDYSSRSPQPSAGAAITGVIYTSYRGRTVRVAADRRPPRDHEITAAAAAAVVEYSCSKIIIKNNK